MNSKLVLSISLVILIGFTLFVSANMSYTRSGSKANYFTELTLNKGWNLISAFNVAGIADASELKKQDISSVWVYVPQSKKYYQIYPNLDPEFSKQGFDYQYSSFWVYSNKVGTVKYYSSEMSPFAGMPLLSGWNFITIFPEMKGKRFNDIKGTCTILKMCDFQRQNWDCADGGAGGIDVDSNVGIGMIIKVSENCQFGASSITTPPAIP